ncbi:MAG TPA: YiiD C-terminal domain-containing protein [Pedobacter sp.]|jgi:acyl-coenzyme A thioesterase PaaI-like protein
MKITELPFNKLIDLNFAGDDDSYILTLEDNNKYTNHLGTVHASALFSLAEATSGQFLLTNFPDYKGNLIPVVRKAEVKYKKPAFGQIYSTATILEDTIENINEQIATRSRAIVKLKVDLFDSKKVSVMTADFEWFVSKSDTFT